MSVVAGAVRQLEVAGRVAVAWSGGADSSALLHAAIEVLGTDAVTALHVDHGMRPGSADDAAFCASTAASIGVGFDATALTLGDCTEATARIARYTALGSMCAAHSIGTLFTAHHADDNLETLLLALLRGSGLVGLAGIRPRLALEGITRLSDHSTVQVIRPLLDVPRTALTAYLGDRAFLTDPSNALLDRRRNRVRHEVVPTLLAIADTPAPLLAAAATLRRDRELIEHLATQALASARRGDGFVARTLLAEPGLSPHAIRALLGPHTPHPPEAEAVDRVERALRRGRGGRFQVRGAELSLHRGIVRVGPAADDAAPDPVALPVPCRCVWAGWAIQSTSCDAPAPGTEADTEWFDAAAIELPLWIRAPAQAERVRWFGGVSRRIRRRLADRGWPLDRRATVPVITDSRGTVLLVGGAGRSAAAPLPAGGGAAIRISCNVTRTHEDCGDAAGSL